jgi:hypothetical protein
MNMRAAIFGLCILTFSGCGGGSRTIMPLTTATVATSPTPPSPTNAALIQPRFTFLPSSSSSATRRPHYITANVASVEITLDTVNGTAPSTGMPLTVTTNISMTSCPCVAYGPDVPAGSATFTLAAYDQPNAGGSLIATASPTYKIVAGQTNNENVTLNGVPATLSMALPIATAGTAFLSPQNISVTAKDGDGNTILGTYATPIALNDPDTSGATSITTGGSDSPPAGQLLSSSDTATIAYTGLAVAPIAISASAKAANASASFAPALQPIRVATGDTQNPNFIGIALFPGVPSGTFSASEAGWTNAPYNKSLTMTVPSACASIGSVAPASGTSFTATVSGSPLGGTCAAALSDGAGQSQPVTLAYTQYLYTGAPQSITVPAGVTNVEVLAFGSQGGAFSGISGGLGGEVDAVAPTLGGQILWIYVGGNVSVSGGAPAGGFNGGGVSFAGLGGGASDVRTTFNNVNSRLIVAPGGGGAGDAGPVGGGGAVSGSNGAGPNPGIGATISGPGAGGTNGQPGTLGAGGTGSLTNGATGGGGGGGYYGGGGGGDSSGGGGGSSYIDASCYALNVFVSPVNSGSGVVILKF